MKQLRLLSVIFLLAIFACSCSGRNDSHSSANILAANSEPVASTTSTGATSWSCVIDGTPASGGILDKDQQFNAAYVTDVDKGKSLLFKLTNIKSSDPLAKFTRSLRFSIPYKSGRMAFGHEEDAWGIQVNIIPESTDGSIQFATAQYNSDSFTVDITSLTSSRVSGTFSGKFMLGPDTPKGGKQNIDIVDGKFDIPMSTTRNMPL